MTSDGSGDYMVAMFWIAVIGWVVLIAIIVGSWLHGRSEARADAACAAKGGARIEAGNGDYCVRRDALLPTSNDAGGAGGEGND